MKLPQQTQIISDAKISTSAKAEPIAAYPVAYDADKTTKISHLDTVTTTIATATDPINEQKISELIAQGFTRGLALSLNDSTKAFANRIWIIDNSGSMQTTDGHRMVPTTKEDNAQFVPCSRWQEIQECVRYHVQLSGSSETPTTFRLLNQPVGINVEQVFRVCEDEDGSYEYSMQKAFDNIRNTRPGGWTPLTSHIRDIHSEISAMSPQLRATGERVVIVLATDGLPTNSEGTSGPREQKDFIESLRLLESLPVWVVIRLCTDDDNVINFYNDIDVSLERSVEVLDDFMTEAEEVYQCNPWLNYGLPLHRMREMGYHDRVFDMLDERLLTKTELRDFMSFLFGEENMDGVWDPSVNWEGFVSDVEQLLKKEQATWDPLKKRMKPWICVRKLNQMYKYPKHAGMFGCLRVAFPLFA